MESDCKSCNFSNMEYKQSKYVWNQQLAGFSASYLSFNTAMHIHIQLPMTVITSWSRWHFTVWVISLLDTVQMLHSENRVSMKMFQMFVTIFKCFVRNQSPRNGADDKMRSRSLIQKSPYVRLSEEHVQNTSNSTFHLLKKTTKNKKKKKHKKLNSVGQVWSYIDYVFILSPAANAFQHQQ